MTGFRTAPLPGPFGLAVNNVNVTIMTDAGLQELLLKLYENRFLVLRSWRLSKRELVTFAGRASPSRNGDRPSP